MYCLLRVVSYYKQLAEELNECHITEIPKYYRRYRNYRAVILPRDLVRTLHLSVAVDTKKFHT
jgi:hypothetical protein